MKIYSCEKSIENLILAQAKTCVAASLFDLRKPDGTHKEKSDKIATASIGHPDLMCGYAILASTVMNKNDDVFLPEETWIARNTPIDTPFNQDHEEKNIIGHIISSNVMTEDGSEYTGSDIPDYFDIGVGFVVYKDIFPSIAAGIATLGPEGKLFVSMEAIMKDFDYALISQSSDEFKIVKRNEATAFLTKSLRIYGGNGIYGDYKIGRVLRDFRFSGMANVDDPANPKSVYLNVSANVKISQSKLKIAAKDVFDNLGSFIFYSKGNVMVIDTLDKAKEKIDELEKVNAGFKDLKSQLDNASAENKTLKDTQASISNELKASVEAKQSLEAKLSIAEKSAQDLQTSLEKTAADAAAIKGENDALKATVEQYKKASMKNDRTAAMKNLGIDLSDEEADKYASMSSDTFNEILSFAEKKMKKGDKKDDTKDKDKDAKDKKDAEAAAQAALDAAKESKEAADAENAAGNSLTKDQEIVAIANRLGEALLPKNRGKSKIKPEKNEKESKK